MATLQVEAGTPLASSIQTAAQAKLMEHGWAPELSDTTLSEYVTMMLVNGKDMQGVQSELGGELLGVGEDDPQVAEFTRWLFDQARQLSAPAQAMGAEMEGAETADSTMDEQMGDALSSDGVPSGPKAMRHGDAPMRGRGRGAGGRILNQMNRSMDRTASDDPLRRIKGAASGAGRIDAHSQRAPRGPRGGGLARGMERAMNGGGRGGAMGMGAGPMGNGGMMNVNGMPPDQQMMFMQMMEMQANMMSAYMAHGGAMPSPTHNTNGGYQGPRGGGRGGKSMFDRINKPGRKPSAATSQNDDGSETASAMDIDRPLEAPRQAPFDTMCKFNLKCLNPDCGFAHQSPANTRPGISLDMSDTCAYGPACTNNKCLGRHPSPAQRNTHFAGNAPPRTGGKSEVVCRFYPNCTAGASCPFKHPDQRPCRNGADCSVENCPFAHSTIACRYNPCTRRDCPFKHAAGQKRGAFEDKVWTAEDGSAGLNGDGGKSERFAGLKAGEGKGEELILPGQNGGAANGEGMAETQQESSQLETQITMDQVS